MLYGYKEMLDNRIATLVVAADTVEEFTGFIEVVPNQLEDRNWEETYASNFLDAMRSETYKGYKHSVLAVYHSSEEQRDAFWAEWSIQETKSAAGRDRQLDMLHAKKEEIRLATETEEDRARTIGDRSGLDVIDPWDRRSEEEKEQDKAMKKQMEEMRKKGELSGDSFGGAEAQKASRTSNPNANNVPGAYSRSQAAEALKSFDPDTDYDSKTNEELAQDLANMGVPDVKGVYDDGQVPQKAKETAGEIYVEDIKGERNEDGSFDVSGVMAHKHGAVDEVQKAANEAAHEENVAAKKGGRRSFSPGDFAAVLRGDGSADAVTNVKGDNRHTRQAAEAPKLSDEAEAARQEHQEQERKEMKRRRAQAAKEQDVKARGERDRGVFKGGDLIHDDEPTLWDDLPAKVREMLEEAGLKRDDILVKNYPYNSELGGRALMPYDGDRVEGGMRMIGGVNLDVEGTVTMNGPGVMVVSRKDTTEDGYGIYARRRKPKIKPVEISDVAASEEATTGEALDVPEPEAPKDIIDVWLVRVRAS